MVYSIVKTYEEGTKSIICVPCSFTSREAARDYLKDICQTVDGDHGEIFDVSFDIEENPLYEEADQGPRDVGKDLEDVTFEDMLDEEDTF